MPFTSADLRAEFAREIEHWRTAVDRLANLDAVAPPQAWQSLEHYVGVALREALTTVLRRLKGAVATCERELGATPEDRLPGFQARIVDLRQAYVRAETTIDFYSDALATRAIPRLGALLRACDHLATRSMAEVLAPLGREVPAALTYVDKGLGAAILKSGLRLWDGTVDNPVATIKVTLHNLLRPSALVHESGHMVSHMLGWTPQLADALRADLGGGSLGEQWAAWASEVSADAFAHVHTGFAAAVALHDVLDGADATVFQYLPGDPHPVSYVRVLSVLAMSRRTFGDGPWDRMAAAWQVKHPIDRCPSDIRPLIEQSVRELPRIVETILYRPYRAFGGRPLTALINPARVSPQSLEQLARDAGSAAFTSPYWTWNEAIRLMALNGYRAGLGATQLREAVDSQEHWMLQLGGSRAAA